MRMVWAREWLLPIGLGAVAALGQAPFGLWPLTLVAMAVALASLERCHTWRRAARLGWLLGCGYFLLAMVWIVQPFFVDPWRHGWMAPFALSFMAGGLALFWALGFGLARRFGGVWVLFATLTLAELLRSYVFTGFPWALIGHSLIDTPLAQIAAIAGAHGLSVLLLLGSFGLWALWRRDGAVGGVIVLALAGCWMWGQGRLSEPAPQENRPVLRLIQPNAPQHQKWDPAFYPIFFQRQVAFTSRPAPRRPDLILWPETAVPVLLEDGLRVFQTITEAAAGSPVVLGLQRYEGLNLYNSAVLLDPVGQVAQVYDKHHLVPFGEYIPLGSLLSGWGLHGLAASDGNGFAAGPGPVLMELGALGRALPLICYEAVFPADATAPGVRPDFLMQLTNDAWFGTFSGPYQHLAQARLRAIEQGLPMVRVANTGVSAMIDAKGRITAQIGLGRAGWVDAALPLPAPPTVYVRLTDWGVGTVLLLVVLSAALINHRKVRRETR